MLNNTERLEKVVFSGGLFSVKNVVTLGQKTATGNRLDPIYTREYNSTKYNNLNSLKVTRFTQNEYLAFCYNDFENKLNEEIFISYPHMPGLIAFIEDICTVAFDPQTYTNNSVSMNAKDTVIESDPFASGKKMIAVPAVWDGKEREVKKGVLLFLNSEEVAVQLDLNAINSLAYIISNFNLSLESSMLMIMGMCTELERGGGAPAPTGFKSESTGIQQKTNRGLFTNSAGNKRRGLGSGAGIGTNNVKRNNIQQQVNDMVEEDEVEEQPPVQQSTGRKKLSMGAVMEKASEINVDDIDDVEI